MSSNVYVANLPDDVRSSEVRPHSAAPAHSPARMQPFRSARRACRPPPASPASLVPHPTVPQPLPRPHPTRPQLQDIFDRYGRVRAIDVKSNPGRGARRGVAPGPQQPPAPPSAPPRACGVSPPPPRAGPLAPPAASFTPPPPLPPAGTYAFVEYDDPRDATEAVRSEDGASAFGGRLRVGLSCGGGWAHADCKARLRPGLALAVPPWTAGRW
jgi:hypothetical protein